MNIDKRFRIRQPAVAGSFYPGNSNDLSETLNRLIRKAKPTGIAKPVGIVVPHAGYVYSGQIAADAFNQTLNYEYDIVVILGANHTTADFNGISVYSEGGFLTPLGVVEVDEYVSSKLLNEKMGVTFDEEVHQREHSVEVVVPFVQKYYPDLQIVPVIIGTSDLDICKSFSDSLCEVLRDRNPLIVASSDLSHFPNYDDAMSTDRRTIEAILRIDPEIFLAEVEKHEAEKIPGLVTSACGESPVITAMYASKKLGANKARLITYCNSGDISRDHSRVVGYAAVSFDEDRPSLKKSGIRSRNVERNLLNDFHKATLLSMARLTILNNLKPDSVLIPDYPESEFQSKQGAFVTLYIDGQLRGCIGLVESDIPLKDLVCEMAFQSAFNDSRFSPVTIDEFDKIDIKISVLTPEKSANPDDIKIGRDGVTIKKDGKSALFLPNVAVDNNWSKEEMFEHLCMKANLPRDGWKSSASFSTFESIDFSEGDYK